MYNDFETYINIINYLWNEEATTKDTVQLPADHSNWIQEEGLLSFQTYYIQQTRVNVEELGKREAEAICK